MSDDSYVIGVDYGTLSGRAVLVRVSDGKEIASAIHEYRHAVIEEFLPSSGAKLPPDWALQVPSDYVDVLKVTIPEVLKKSGIDSKKVICDECGWSWSLDEGGDDPLTCHKCGHINKVD